MDNGEELTHRGDAYQPTFLPVAAADPPPSPPRKRRRRRKQFPEMVPSHAVRVLRSHASSRGGGVVYSEKHMDDLFQSQIAGDYLSNVSSSSRSRRISSSSSSRLARDIDVEALIAISVGFPIDSLIEEEIESNVIPVLGGDAQANYIIVRNHLLALWRTNPSVWLTEDAAASAIRSEHHHLVSAAHSFLRRYAYINFGIVRNPPPPPLPSSSVIIVGAGFAGLGAARHLISLGFKVVVLEGRLRPGGRVLTRKMQGPGVVAAVDLGGSVLTGINGNPLGVLARQLGFPLHKVRDKCPLYLPNGQPVDCMVDSRIEATFNQLLEKVCKLREATMEELKSVDVSLGEALEAFRRVYGVAEPVEERMLLDWHLANLEYANAAMLSDLSLAFWDQDDPYEMGGDHCFIPGGNVHFIRAMAEGIPTFYGKTVRRIQYGSDGVMVYVDGQVFHGDMVLCTVSLGVLKKGIIEFVPPLPPQKQEAIDSLGFGLLNKVAMLFPYNFWGRGIDTFGHLTEDSSQRGEFFLFYSYCSVSGGPLLVALVAGESAINFENAPPTEPAERVLNVLRNIFAPKGIQVPDPVQVICTRWGADEFTYGSYSYVAVGSSGDDYDILAESIGDGRVFFAGEATNRRYPATMHGALLSGYREAANMARVAERRSIVPIRVEVDDKVEDVDLDDLFKSPDLSFGSFLVLHDPADINPDHNSLVRVGIRRRKLESGSLFLYGLISRKHVLELARIDGDEQRVDRLYRSFGTKLVGKNGLGKQGEDLIQRIKVARSTRKGKIGTVNGIHHA
ncbi:Lysine-specific histone demethylase 1 like 1 [Apostasia shenzhenica]|uniref:Lysine-specific histone demethylase 1 like 1 n=1 Tax=Apostasia shenzhenica TaxID=1088818 RepID=A0A2I0AYA2_9ASPA|nr:Lysine-specific histone demethylase 1 like 1 [Apostasia shenzhenica]